MGSIVGAALLSHSPVIMFPEPQRREINHGQDFTLATGLESFNREVFQKSDFDTVIVVDSHWFTTTEFIITAHTKREGIFTSSEMPTLLRQIPYAFNGDPELAQFIANTSSENPSWVVAVDDPYLPLYYSTLNLWSRLQHPNKNWLSLSVCQTATTQDFLQIGRQLRQAITKSNRRVLIIGSGGLSHQFQPLQSLTRHMHSGATSIARADARQADEQRVEWMRVGNHYQVIEKMPEYLHHQPEGLFAHYLIAIGALGGTQCRLKGQAFSNYENGIGTGQIHLWWPNE